MAWRLTEDMFAQFHKLAFSYRVPPFVYLFVAAHTTLAYCLEEMLLERTQFFRQASWLTYQNV